MSYAPVLVRDGRLSTVSLAQQGFQVVAFHSQLRVEALDDRALQDLYYPEVCAAVQEATGADLVIAFHHRHRKGDYDDRVHGDYNPESAIAVLKWQLEGLGSEYQHGHYQLINAWRNLRPTPVQHDHLALCDARSCQEQQLLLGAGAEEISAASFEERVQGPKAWIDFADLHQWLARSLWTLFSSLLLALGAESKLLLHRFTL